MALGTDIVKISRIESLIADKIPEKVFSDEEILYINSKKNKAETAAGIFAAKEAILKALGCGIVLPLNQAVVLHDQNGMPIAALRSKVLEFARQKGIDTMEISISHDGEYAIACAVSRTYFADTLSTNITDKFKTDEKNAILPSVVYNLLPKRQECSHKGSYGRLYVLAGSKGLTGAAIMACTAALKCGAGLISLGCAQELNDIFEISMKEVMTKPLLSENGIITQDNIPKITEEISACDLCLAGPGLGRNQHITSVTRSILSGGTTPIVADADALYAMAEDMTALKNHTMPLTITPHIGEFSRLTGLSAEEILSSPQKYAMEFAKENNIVVVLKSHRTVVASPDGTVYVNVLGNPGMATGGSGDVLSGAIASFAVQGISPFKAAVLGVYIHSLAADIAAEKTGEYSLTPSDIIDHIPTAIQITQKGSKEMF